MRFLWSRRGLALAAATLIAGCSVSMDDASDSSGSGSGSTGTGAKDSYTTTVAFADSDTLTLAPGDTAEVSVIVSPPQAIEVDFALLGDALDASLDRSSVTSTSAGRASVKLRAPTMSTTFRVRATVAGGAYAEAGVSVGMGFGDVQVVPSYSGKRPITEWTASVTANKTCAEVSKQLPNDPLGGIYATAAPPAQPLVKKVPVGPKLAVAIRAGHFAWGCTDVTGLAANTTLDVTVNIVDKPIVLSETDLALDFDYAPDPAEYAPLLDEATALVAAAVAPDGASYEAGALLDAMAPLAQDSSAFADARLSQSWDDVLAKYLQTNGVSIAGSISSWAATGLAAEPLSLRARLKKGSKGATLSGVVIGDVAGGSAGVPASTPASFMAGTGDMVSLSATLSWIPSKLVATVATKEALVEEPTATSMPDAIATVVDCTSAAGALGGYSGCDAHCLALLCRNAIATLWAAAPDASTTNNVPGSISLTATGTVSVDDMAVPSALSGTWLGEVDDTVHVAKVQGKVAGAPPDNPP